MTPHRTSHRRPLSLLLLLLFTVLLAGSAAALTREVSETHPLAAGGSVSLENVNGDLTVEAWDRAEVSVEAVVKADRQEDLDAMQVDIDASAGRVAIETKYPERSSRNTSVDYTLRIPRDARLDEVELVNGALKVSGVAGGVIASLVNGKAEASDLAGSVELSTVNGSLAVSFADLAAGQKVTLESVNGSVSLTLPARVDAEVSAETVHGRIRNDFGLEEKVGEYVGSSLEGTIGRGGAKVALESVNGAIDIRQAR